MFTYLVIGMVVAIIVLLIFLAHSDPDDRLLKAKQLSIWVLIFILATILWPLVIFFGLAALLGE